jgi:pyruvate-formate lyase-activating enzyme
VAETESRGCQGTSISFNEPTLSLEWSREVFRLARQRGLYNTYVTNGYMTPEALSLLMDSGLDAMNVDVKGDAAACPGCSTLLIKRLGFDVVLNAIRGGRCPHCGRRIAGVWGGK